MVPASQCGSIIGKGGAKIKEIREVSFRSSTRKACARSALNLSLDNRCVCSSGIGNVADLDWTCCDYFRQTWFDRIMFPTNMPDYARSKSIAVRKSRYSSSTLFSSRHPKVKQFHIDRKWWSHLSTPRSFLPMDKPIKSKGNSQFLCLLTRWDSSRARDGTSTMTTLVFVFPNC